MERQERRIEKEADEKSRAKGRQCHGYKRKEKRGEKEAEIRVKEKEIEKGKGEKERERGDGWKGERRGRETNRQKDGGEEREIRRR